MFEIRQTDTLANNLYVLYTALAGWFPLPQLQALVSSVAAIFAIWLMQKMTRISGIRGVVPCLRLTQRVSLAWLAIGLALNGASDALPYGKDLINLVISVSLFFLLGSSIVLTYVRPSEH